MSEISKDDQPRPRLTDLSTEASEKINALAEILGVDAETLKERAEERFYKETRTDPEFLAMRDEALGRQALLLARLKSGE